MGLITYVEKRVENKFDQILYYNRGLAAARKGNLWGYINRGKEVVIPIIFEEVSRSFSKGIANVKLNGKYGFINDKGEIVIPIKYDWAEVIDGNLIQVLDNDKWGIYDTKGNVVIPTKYDRLESWFHAPKRHLFLVSSGDKFGLVNKKGKEVAPIQYDWIFGFHDDMALVVKGSLYGFIDTAGKEIIPPKYNIYAVDRLDKICFKNGYARLQLLKTLYIYIDKKGNEYAKKPRK